MNYSNVFLKHKNTSWCMKMASTIYGADLFAGAGGTSTGLIFAVEEMKRKLDLTAVNHWEAAIKTHEANYPWAKHLQADVEAVNPVEAIPGGHLDILVASPECIYYSRAAGGRPKNEQKRASAWAIFRWLELLRVDSVLVENVPEFSNWGALDARGHPIKLRRGEIYHAWLEAFRAHGYTVDAKVLNAADYGAPTSRNRLFVAAIRGKKKPTFPIASHSKKGWPKKKWRAAREIIDWSIKGESIFGRKKPLSPRTIQRIMEGLRRFGGRELRPFIILMEHGGGIRDIDEPLPTITTAKGGSMAIAKPEAFVLSQASGGAPRSVKDPVPTIPTKGAHALIEPFLVSYHAGKGVEKRIASVNNPLGTLDTSNRFGLAEPFIVPNFGEHDGQTPRTHSVEDPLPSVTSHGAGALVEPFLLPNEGFYHREGQNKARSLDEPLGTITQRGGGSLVEPFIVKYYGNGSTESVEDPLDTITAKDRFGLAEPYVCQFNGTQESQVKNSVHSIEEPLPTIATANHLALVQPKINGRVLDIRFRMLQPHELASATGFPSKYKFLGTKTDVVRQIGNAVVVDIAKALCLSLLQTLKV
jgi:DNA (cytosine-5)-methyltransferase 1